MKNIDFQRERNHLAHLRLLRNMLFLTTEPRDTAEYGGRGRS